MLLKKLTLVSLFIGALSISNAQVLEADSLILVELFETLDGPNWIDPENWLDGPVSTWKGITVVDDRVTQVEIINQQVFGSFPNSIVNLDKLRTFEIRGGVVSGEIPENLTLLTELYRFIMSGTGLSGDIKNFWTEFEDLEYLSFPFNSLSGNLPDLPEKLKLFYVQNNELTGEIPPSWANMNVVSLQIDNNNLTGSFDIFSDWSEVWTLRLGDNEWDSGPFPEWLDDLPTLQVFECDNCNMTGDLPESLDFSNSPDYRSMFISDNNLSGDISLLFAADDSTEELYLKARNNNFSGEFPAHKVNKFSRLDLLYNDYSSMTEFKENAVFEIIELLYNNFNFASLVPILDYVDPYGYSYISYDSQQKLMSQDTIQQMEGEDVTIFSGDDHPNTQYIWKKDGITIDEAQDAYLDLVSISEDEAGVYTCDMTNSDFPELVLERFHVVLEVEVNTNVSENANFHFEIFPNPTNDFIQVKTESNTLLETYQIFNSLGEIVLDGIKPINKTIDVSSIPTGTYIIQVNTSNETVSRKLIKL